MHPKASNYGPATKNTESQKAAEIQRSKHCKQIHLVYKKSCPGIEITEGIIIAAP